jgi:hypothetical protein
MRFRMTRLAAVVNIADKAVALELRDEALASPGFQQRRKELTRAESKLSLLHGFNMLAKKTVKNQITLPKSIIDRLPKTDYFEVSLRGEEILLRPVVIESKGKKLDRIRKKIKALGLTEKDVDAAIRWARTR